MDIAGMKKGEIMLVPTARMVDAYIRKLPPGANVDVRTLRHRLARQYDAEVTCPITTGFHLRTVAEAAYEAYQSGAALEEVTPFWRVLDEGSPTTGRLACGVAFVREQRAREGIAASAVSPRRARR
jgi:hypothetical protein